MEPFIKFEGTHKTLFTYLERRSKTTLFVWSLGLVSIIGGLDYFSGGTAVSQFDQ